MHSRAVRHAWVDVAKGISILLVVMVHTRSWLDYAGIEAGPVMDELISASNHVRMPLFFFAAGLFASKWVAHSWRDLANGKLALLLWVFLLWQVAMFAYKTIGGAILPDQNDAGVASQLLRVVVSPLRPNAELWFLWALVIYFVAAKLLSRMRPAVSLILAGAVSVAWSGVVLNTLSDSLVRAMGPGLEKLPMFFVFFLAASLFSRQLLTTVASANRWWATAYLALWIVLFPVLDIARGLSDVPGVVFVLQVAGLFAGVSAALLLAWCTPLRYLGERTLPVYVTHTTFIVTFASVLYVSEVRPVQLWAQAGVAWLALGASVALGLLLYRFAADTFLFRQPRWFALRSRHRIAAG